MLPAAGSRPLPQRAIGIAHMAVGVEARRIGVAIEAPETTHPRQTLSVPVRLANLDPGEKAYMTLAAVDVGILSSLFVGGLPEHLALHQVPPRPPQAHVRPLRHA